MTRAVLGHIDCPTCGTPKGMRVTLDKNGEPFGFCEATCRQQLRTGGDKFRVAAFLKRFPWASGKPADPAPVTVTGKPAAPAPAPNPPKPARAPVDNPFDFLLKSGRAAA